MRNVRGEFMIALLEEMGEISCICQLNTENHFSSIDTIKDISNSLFLDAQLKRKNEEYILLTQVHNFYNIFLNASFDTKVKKVSKN